MAYQVAIIGCGGQGVLSDAPGSGNEHKCISFAKAFKINPNFEIFLFVDSDIEKAQEAKKIWGSNWVTNNLDFAITNIDIFVVTTPDNTHYEILKKLIKYKPKLVVCEKPLCENTQQAREIIKLYKEKNIPILVNYTRRFIPELQQLKKDYKEGKFGELIYARAIFNKGWIHTGSHAIDFFNWLEPGIDCDLDYIKDANYRIWQIELFFEHYYWCEKRIGNMLVPSYYDNHTQHVVKHIYNYLNSLENLFCTAEDALFALEGAENFLNYCGE